MWNILYRFRCLGHPPPWTKVGSVWPKSPVCPGTQEPLTYTCTQRHSHVHTHTHTCVRIRVDLLRRPTDESSLRVPPWYIKIFYFDFVFWSERNPKGKVNILLLVSWTKIKFLLFYKHTHIFIKYDFVMKTEKTSLSLLECCKCEVGTGPESTGSWIPYTWK